MSEATPYRPTHHVRVVTATSLFDGHDAAINIMRRILQDAGAEVIHLGHNRSAREIVDAAIQEDVQAIAVSSYQGGHMEFFRYMLRLLQEQDAADIQVFGGGGGVIVPPEISELQASGVSRVYSPDDGRIMGLQGMIDDLLKRVDRPVDVHAVAGRIHDLSPQSPRVIARFISAVEKAKAGENGDLSNLAELLRSRLARTVPVVGFTGTGGAGKSSLTDEIVTRFLNDFDEKAVAVLSMDPSRRKTGGALLGDRIRVNALTRGRVFFRSLATRSAGNEVSAALAEAIQVLKAARFDLILVETAGIGQGDAAVVPFVDLPVYVMTSDFGAPSQLEKIDMLDYAEIVVINKFDRKGSEDALRDVRKQFQRNRRLFDQAPENMPVYGTIAARFNDDGVSALYHALIDALNQRFGLNWRSGLPRPAGKSSSAKSVVIPPERIRYLSEVGDTVRDYHRWVDDQAETVQDIWRLDGARELLDPEKPEDRAADRVLDVKRAELLAQVDPECLKELDRFEKTISDYASPECAFHVRGREVKTPLFRESLAGTMIPRVALPKYENPGDRLRWLLRENIPGRFPFTAGVFPFKRTDEDPTRMFAGEGSPARTNRRFKYLSANYAAKRLSTAFDSVTLYGQDPDEQPDIYGKVGNSGVSICTLDDMKVLYGGFDLCAPNTSVSMTINGPAPMILAMFFNTAIDREVEKFTAGHGREPDAEERERIEARVLSTVRGTVQADILKEDQGQNTCIFAIDFALKMMGDIQQFFIDRDVRNFYSVSISGYHIAEAGANPITQTAFTLANGFTYVEYYLSRGMHVDDFAPNLSFFFSNGMDPEYAVINRVARRIWAVALKNKYRGAERSRKLKAHIQTSGRSLHAQDIQFNDIRTTLQALTALYDNCNSLHTNSYDEAITTPTEESVRRALAIQLIINKEFGLYKNENAIQGSFIIEELTRLVEEAILSEFDRLTSRGGVLGAMETGYQRAKIQEESLLYETKKTDGSLPIVGVNTFLRPGAEAGHEDYPVVLTRAAEEEKADQLRRLRDFQARHASEAPEALARLKQTALSGGNIFAELMKTVRVCSLGRITQALYEVGGRYRRNM